MTFKNLDSLYRSSPDAYRELLQFMQTEFKDSRIKILSSIEKGDLTAFSHIKHKISSTLNTLEYTELVDTLAKVKEEFGSASGSTSSNLTLELKEQLNHLLSSIDGKIVEIDTVGVM